VSGTRRGRLDGRATSNRDVVDRVRRVIGTHFAEGSGAPDLGVVAERLGTSVRTLQRRFRAAGLTYAQVAQEARCAVARRMLRETRRKVGAIATKLGYSDHAHFTRAFQRWTGLTPREFRRRG
jgi:AraC-like DNA-binding protein